MAGSSRSSFRRSFAKTGSPRKSSWALGPKSGTAGGIGTAFTASTAIIGTVGAAAALDGITVVRIRGEFVAFLNSASGNLSGFHGAFGIGLARSPAFDAGITSLPTPITEEFQDNWLFHSYFSLMARGGITSAGVSLSGGQQDSDQCSIRLPVDSKAKLLRNDDLDDPAMLSSHHFPQGKMNEPLRFAIPAKARTPGLSASRPLTYSVLQEPDQVYRPVPSRGSPLS